MKYRVWWIPQVPMQQFYTPEVDSIETAKILANTLAEYDIFQFENNVKPDYCNAGGIQYFDETQQEWLAIDEEEDDAN